MKHLRRLYVYLCSIKSIIYLTTAYRTDLIVLEQPEKKSFL